jgi:uncharacterized membrane protein YfcA
MASTESTSDSPKTKHFAVWPPWIWSGISGAADWAEWVSVKALVPAMVALMVGAGVFGGLGLGGGLVFRPVLLALGWTDHLAVATSCLLTVVTGLTAGLLFAKFKLADWVLALWIGPATALGSFVGGLTAAAAPELWLSIFAVLGLWGGAALAELYTVRGGADEPAEKPAPKQSRATLTRTVGEYHYSISLPLVLPVALASGFVGAWMGIGGGLVLVPMLMGPLKVPAKIAVGTSALNVIVVGLTAMAGHAVGGSFAGFSVLMLVPAVAVGAALGAVVSSRLPQRVLRRMVTVACLSISLLFIYRTVAHFMR